MFKFSLKARSRDLAFLRNIVYRFDDKNNSEKIIN